MPIDGGAPELVFPNPAEMPPLFLVRSVSPDERWAAGTYFDARVRKGGLTIIPLDAREPAAPRQARRELFEHTRSGFSFVGLARGLSLGWSPDGQALEDVGWAVLNSKEFLFQH